MRIKFSVQEGTERLSSHSGLALIGALMDETRLKARLSRVRLQSCPEPEISHSDVACSMIGLLCLGKPDFAAIEPFRLKAMMAMRRCLRIWGKRGIKSMSRKSVSSGKRPGLLNGISARSNPRPGSS